ncbi:tetratricopeptide repeat protein [Anaerolineales bacterium HSG25]|nr:tetratricopeptide repeat protein [Anaerolineales bacterium HSG25]
MSNQITKRNTTQNPYIVGSPIKGKEMFFGRDDIFEKICRHLMGKHRDNPIIIQGQRRTGKTSVLYQMERYLNARAGEERYQTVMLDLQGMDLSQLDAFLLDLAFTIEDALIDRYDLPELDEKPFEANARKAFRDYLLTVQTATGIRLVLMFDEAMRFEEAILNSSMEREIFDHLRHLIQHTPDICFVFSLGSKLESLQSDYTLTLNNAITLEVSFLEQASAHKLITEPVAGLYSFDEAAISRLLTLTSGHPYFTQIICHTIFARWEQARFKRVTVADIDDSLLDEATRLAVVNLKYVWDEAKPNEKFVLSALAEMGSNKASPKTIEKHLKQAEIPLSAKNISHALQELRNREVVALPRMHVALVERWLAKEKPLQSVRGELHEFVPEVPDEPVQEESNRWKDKNLYGKFNELITLFGMLVGLVAICALTVSIYTSQNQPIADYEIGEIIKSGEYEERIELEDAPVNNCKNKSSETYTVQRNRSLEESVEITLTADMVTDEMRLAVGGEYGFEENGSGTDSSDLKYTIESGNFPVYTIAWKETWEKGHVVIMQNGKEEKMEYRYLTSAQPELLNIEHFTCDEPGLARATDIAQGKLPWQIDFDQGKQAYADGDYETTIKAMSLVIQTVPYKISAYNYRGIAYDDLEQYEQAIADYDKAIELDPNYVFAYYNRGNVYDDLEQYEQAIADYDKAIELDPNYAFAYYNRGIVYKNLEQYEQAIADYDKAIELDPKYVDAYYNRGNAYYNQKRYEDAIADYNKAIELDPKYVDAYNNRGNAYRNLEQYEQAIADYDKAIELDPNYVNAYYYRGIANAKLEQYEQAIADFDKAIELDPNFALAYNNRGSAYADLEQYEKAIADFDKAIELDHDPLSWPYNNRGNAYRNLGQHEQAIADYDKAIELDPNYANAYYGRGNTYKKQDEKEKAIADFRRYLELATDPYWREQAEERLRELGATP